ncbi:MAG: hypothetical protein F9K16_09190 [Thermoanaerobaculia bacterium]|nr:MAG: hypothetical protein F9K16_09190 [Thermoanaerobaculia bacterium]MBZ0103101.1 hypothetical protein [Thermoanaerobaculia bacterium]
MPLLSGRTPARAAALWAFLLHTAAVLWIHFRWQPGLGDGVLAWMDFPLSLLWGHLSGGPFLAFSLLAGGALWAVLAAGLTRLVGRLARPDGPPAPGR